MWNATICAFSNANKLFSFGSLKEFLMKCGIVSSKSTLYHPTGNSQVERFIGVIWKSARLALKSYNLPLSCWENVLQNALHSVRSLLNTTKMQLLMNFSLVLVDILLVANPYQPGSLFLVL